MECNKDEAIRAKEIAEKKMERDDFEGARKLALKAKNLYPELDNITQLLSICDVHCSAQNGLMGSEKDWYGILQVEKLANEITVKKQYRRLALILHPDKNRFPGAEAAFKLICEANALLSDPVKKTLYDAKVRVSTIPAPVNPPNRVNQNPQPKYQYSAQNNVSNGHSSLNQHQTTQPTSSIKPQVFWTCCPFCNIRYQYFREHVNKSLFCPSCRKIFVAYEVSAQSRGSGTKPGPPGPQHGRSKPDSSRPAVNDEQVVPNPQKFKMGAQTDKGAPGGYQEFASKKSVRPEPGVQTGIGSKGIKVGGADKDRQNLKTKETDNKNTNSLHVQKEGRTSNGNATQRETGDLSNKSRKRGRKESSESCDTSNHSDLNCESSHVHFQRRSSRKRQPVSYKETEKVTDVDDPADPLKQPQETEEGNVKVQKDASVRGDSKHGYRNSSPKDADYSKLETKKAGNVHSKENLLSEEKDKVRGETGKWSTGVDTVVIESDSDLVTSCDESESDLCICPEPEFSDFEKVRDEFDVNQFWACYDTCDGMPRFYAKVKKVRSSPFELSITWLEADPIDESFDKWVDDELPVGCGTFKLGNTEKTSVRLSFSHRVNFEKGKKRGSLFMYPSEGEVWALFKDWDPSWTSNPEIHSKDFKYEIVEVLSNFVAGSGIRVVYLDKVSGFVSLFQRASPSETNSFVVKPNEVYKFSHHVPFFKMTGSERKGVPIGSFELDPAALPLNPKDLYYPGKAKMEDKKTDPEVHCSPKKKGKSVVSEDVSTPKKIVDLEGVMGEKFEVRKSPRGKNVRSQNAV